MTASSKASAGNLDMTAIIRKRLCSARTYIFDCLCNKFQFHDQSMERKNSIREGIPERDAVQISVCRNEA
jgi:hypothetical protein